MSNFEKSVTLLEDLKRQFRGSILYGEINYRLAIIYYLDSDYALSLKNLDEALSFFESSGRKDAQWWADDALFLKTFLEYKGGNYDRVFTLIERYKERFDKKLYSAELEYVEQLARLKTQKLDGFLYTLHKTYDRLRKENKAKIYYKIGHILYDEGSYVSAGTYFIKGGATFTRRELKEECYFWSGEAFYKGDLLSRSKQFYRKALQIGLERGEEASYGIAWINYSRERYRESRKYFRRLLDSNNKDISRMSRYFYAKSFFNQKKYPSSVSSFQRFINNFPTSSLVDEAFFYKGVSYFRQEKYYRAQAMFKRLLEDYPFAKHTDRAKYYFLKAIYKRKKYETFVSKIEEMQLDSLPGEKRFELIYLAERTKLKLGKYESPLDIALNFSQAHPQSPFLIRLLFEVANTLKYGDDYEHAQRVYQLIKRQNNLKDEEWARAQFQIGKIALLQGDSLDAREVFNRLAGEVPSNKLAAKGLLALGNFYYENQRYKNAIKVFERVNKQFKARIYSYRARIRLGDIYIELGKMRDAREVFSNIYRSVPDTVTQIRDRALYRMAFTYQKEGKFTRAIDFSKKYIDSVSTKSKFYLYQVIGNAYYEIGKTDSTIRYFGKIVDKGEFTDRAKKYKVYYKLAKSLAKKNKFNNSIELLEVVIRNTEDDSLRKKARDEKKIYNSLISTEEKSTAN